jgi:hypothetical protein
MRIAALMWLLAALPVGGTAAAQTEPGASSETEPPEEVVVRGKRLTDLRFEVQVARERAYDLFNDINSNDDFDVYCREEGRTGTRSTQRVCRAQFENRVSADAAKEYVATLFALCQLNSEGFLDTQACMFDGPGQSARSAAQGVEGALPGKHEQMTEEIFRLARENDEFAQAILDWYEANRQYEAARKRRRTD